MSLVNIGKEAVATFQASNGTVGTSPAQVTTLSFQISKHLVVRADSGNSGTITVGTSSAQAANGFVLAAGEQTPPIYVLDPSHVWLVGSGSGQNYSWIAS